VDAGVLYVRYDMEALRRTARRERPAEIAAAAGASAGMWRYAEVLPDVEPVTLGEGWTPMVQSRRYAGLLVKEEGANPAGTVKARGLSMAVTMARHYGLKHLAVASAGNAASALAAYAAAAGIAAHIVMLQDVPFANYLESVLYGADVTMVDGLISDCARMVGERIQSQRASGAAAGDVWFDVSAPKEPYRVEGEKTMGYELVEQLGWTYPDAVFYPAGGAGLIGMWKAFEEMEQLGWVSGRRPKMYALQAVESFAAELRVAKPCGDAIVREIVRRSGGRVMASQDVAVQLSIQPSIQASIQDWAKNDGLFLSPEGAAATAAYDALLKSGELKPSDRVVLFNTGAGLKYVDAVASAMKRRRPGSLPTSMPVGGIITPV
jgi:threonine synthase